MIGFRGKLDRRAPGYRIEPCVRENRCRTRSGPCGAPPASGSSLSPCFEDVREIAGKRQRHGEGLSSVVEVLDLDALVASALPQELGAHDVDRVACKAQYSVDEDVGVREICGQQAIIVLDRGA